MADMFGADVAQLRQLAKDFTSAADTLDRAGRELTSAITRGAWKGSDADRFRQRWTGRLQPALAATSRSLAEGAVTLRENADEQERASDSGGSFGGSGGGSGGGGAGGEGGGSVLDWLKDGWEWIRTAMAPIADGIKLKKIFDAMRLYNAADLLADVSRAAASAKVFLLGDMVDSALGRNGLLGNMLARLGGPVAAVGRWLGPIGGVFSVVGGVQDMISPQHDGWRGWGDRIAGGLSVVSGAGTIALALGAGAALGPVGIGVVVGAGLVAGAWTLGNMIYDNREAIGSAVSGAWNWAGDRLSDAADGVAAAASSVVGGIAEGAGKVGSWIGGLFS